MNCKENNVIEVELYKNERHPFTFDRVFNSNSTQLEVYSNTAQFILNSY